jgi:hypothetical protein
MLLLPPYGTIYKGWNATVELVWSETLVLDDDEYYVVSIPYNEAGEVAEFWRKSPKFLVPQNFSDRQTGFEDRHYNWYVQVKRCTQNCAQVQDDNVKKVGVPIGPRSLEGLFYWWPDDGGPPPTKTPRTG